MSENGKKDDFKITKDNISQVRIAGQTNHQHSQNDKDLSDEELFYRDVNQQKDRIEELIEQIQQFPNPNMQALLAECMEAVLTLHSSGLERIFELIEKTDGSIDDLKLNLLEDDFIKGMLIIHGLHPEDLETRLYLALDKVKPYMDSHGGSVKVVSLENGVAKLKLEGSCDGCPSSVSTLELGIKEAIEEECPDLIGLEVEGLADNPLAREIQKNNSTANAKNGESNWIVVPGLNDLSNSEKKTIQVKGVSLIICKTDNQLYAYGNECPGCGMTFDSGTLADGMLKCKLGHDFDIKKAGKCPDDPDIHLKPFPLLQENGTVKMSVKK